MTVSLYVKLYKFRKTILQNAAVINKNITIIPMVENSLLCCNIPNFPLDIK